MLFVSTILLYATSDLAFIFSFFFSFLQVDYAVPHHELPRIDQHALFQLENVVKNIKQSYECYQFFKIFQVCSFSLTVISGNIHHNVPCKFSSFVDYSTVHDC